MPGLKKSSAPSIVFQRLKETQELPEETTPPQTKKGKEIKRVNHLLQWQLPKETSKSEENESSENKENEDQNEVEDKRRGKNVKMVQDSRPIYYAASFVIQSKTKEASEGLGLIKVSFDTVLLFDDEGKQIGQTSISRVNSTERNDEEEEEENEEEQEEEDEDSKFQEQLGGQKIFIKKKEVFIQKDFSINIGNKKVKILGRVSEEDFLSGSYFLQGREKKLTKVQQEENKDQKPTIRLAAARKPTGFVVPYKGTAKAKRNTEPLFSPYSPEAFILFTPKDLFSENKVHVVVDPMLSKCLRPHQREGIQFLFDIVCMGFHDPTTNKKYHGCILADEMGLGKTIQAITLMWTLLKQGPTGLQAVRKAVIVCPSSLVGNWCKEMEKWLNGQIKVKSIGESTKKGLGIISQFQFEDFDVLVISYDQLKIYAKDLSKVWNIDLVICDEGHRLKNAQIKTSQAVQQLKTPRRIILSGTPIQNDLMELYAMVDYVNPGILGTVKQFKKVWEEPILAAREKDATPEQKEIGRQRSAELTQRTEKFILRRTSVINSKYLPPKIDYLVICKLTPLQEEMYKTLCKVYTEKLFEAGSSIEALPLITALKKLCNSPELIYHMCQKSPDTFKQIQHLFPQEYLDGQFPPEFSAKLHFVDKLLENIRRNPQRDRIVIVSNYTETLEILGKLCKSRGYHFFQLDGSTSVKKRQKLVDEFNAPTAKEFVFLLSSKAGGCGLNLVGANHLMLFDPDWNPANDEQAMARVWRPGQKKKVYLYRVLSTGTLEERVYQRQITKLALSKSVVKSGAATDVEETPSFTASELRDLFKYRDDTICDTHDLLICRCASAVSNGGSRVPRHKRMQVQVDDLLDWEHYHNMDTVKYEVLREAAKDIVTFIFAKETEPMKQDIDMVEVSNENADNQASSDDDDDDESENKDEAQEDTPSDSDSDSDVKPPPPSNQKSNKGLFKEKPVTKPSSEDVIVIDEDDKTSPSAKSTRTSSTISNRPKRKTVEAITINDSDSDDDIAPAPAAKKPKQTRNKTREAKAPAKKRSRVTAEISSDEDEDALDEYDSEVDGGFIEDDNDDDGNDNDSDSSDFQSD